MPENKIPVRHLKFRAEILPPNYNTVELTLLQKIMPEGRFVPDTTYGDYYSFAFGKVRVAADSLSVGLRKGFFNWTRPRTEYTLYVGNGNTVPKRCSTTFPVALWSDVLASIEEYNRRFAFEE